MELLVSRIISVISLLILTLIFGTLPYCLILRRANSAVSWREKLVRYLNCFSGGVFLGCLFLHLMTEGSEQFNKYLETIEYDSEFPFFNTVIIMGFFITSSVEYFTHSVLSQRDQTSPRTVRTSKSNDNEESEHLQSNKGKIYGTLSTGSPVMTHQGQVSKDTHTGNEEEATDLLPSVDRNGTDYDRCHQHNYHCSTPPSHSHSHCHSQGASTIRSILLILALSFHSVFDGLALGLQESSSTIWEIFLAVLLHKCIIAFCLGLDVFTSFSDTKVASSMMVIFSLVSPIGASIGIVLTSSGIYKTAKLLSSGILQGLSCGAFLYVTFLEILNTYWKGNSHHKSFLDIICSFFGFTIMAISKVFDSD